MTSSRILIVEDHASLLRIFMEELTEAGYRATGVTTGEEALALLATENFEVLITDINLAGSVSGIALLGKCSAEYLDTKIIVITGMVGIEDSAVGHSGFPGSNMTLFKPIDYGALTSAVESLQAQ